MGSLTAVGLMSGTSVDGLDIVAANFLKTDDSWSFKVLKTTSVEYPASLKGQLINCIHFNGEDLVNLDIEYGKFIGDAAAEFIHGTSLKPVIIASHGHTVFHQPEKGMTFQIGDGQIICERTGLPVVNDFRKLDVIRGGQGAPLVPVGDKHLFGEYEFCLNIGGFSNVSFDDRAQVRRAYDISPSNIILNHLARKINYDYDPGGSHARKGKVIQPLLDQLNALPYYKQQSPKSLGLEWVEKNIFPLFQPYLNKATMINDLLMTCTEHIATQIVEAIAAEAYRNKQGPRPKVLITGGGAYNDLMIERMRKIGEGLSFEIPDKTIVDFKEALIFAFLGVLRWKGEVNILKSVTGASEDSSGGIIHGIHL